MKKQLYIVAGIVAGLGLFAAGAVFGGGKSASSDSCKNAVGMTYMVTIENDKPSNDHVQAHLCDKIMFMNDDNVTREIAFGPHENHVPYDGVAEQVLNKGGQFTITLNQAGNFHWHDHIHDEVEGYFTVSK